MRRLRGILVAGTVLAASMLVTAPGATATPLAMGQCTTSENVVLAVDFGHWGGPIVRACGSTPTTGYALLNQGGMRSQGTQSDGPAFICRIASSTFRSGSAFPTASEDSCVRTPQASAYWSYWHADRGDSDWSYSSLGAKSYKPKPGSVEYWQFGGTDVGGTKGRPSVTPDELRAHNATASGGGSGSGSSAGSSNGGHGGSKHVDGAGVTRRPGAAASSAPTAPSTAEPTASAGSMPRVSAGVRRGTADASASRPAQASSGAAASSSSSAPAIVDASPAAGERAKDSSGSALPVVLGLLLVLMIGAGGTWTMWRRRSAADGS